MVHSISTHPCQNQFQPVTDRQTVMSIFMLEKYVRRRTLLKNEMIIFVITMNRDRVLDVYWGEASECIEEEVFRGSVETGRWVL